MFYIPPIYVGIPTYLPASRPTCFETCLVRASCTVDRARIREPHPKHSPQIQSRKLHPAGRKSAAGAARSTTLRYAGGGAPPPPPHLPPTYLPGKGITCASAQLRCVAAPPQHRLRGRQPLAARAPIPPQAAATAATPPQAAPWLALWQAAAPGVSCRCAGGTCRARCQSATRAWCAAMCGTCSCAWGGEGGGRQAGGGEIRRQGTACTRNPTHLIGR